VLVLRDVDGQSRREIAEALGISVSSDACASRPVVPPETTRTVLGLEVGRAHLHRTIHEIAGFP